MISKTSSPEKLQSKLPLIGTFGVAPQEALTKVGIYSENDLWNAVGKDALSGISSLSTDTSIDKQELTAYLIALVERERTESMTWWQSHWLGAVALGILSIILLVVLTAALYPRTTRGLVVQAPGLPAYHIITASDVVTSETKIIDAPFTTVDQLVGRFTLAPLAEHDLVHSQNVSQKKLVANALSLHTIVSLPARTDSNDINVAPGQSVTILLTSDSNTLRQSELVTNVLVLDLTQIDEYKTFVLAIPTPEFTRLQSLISSANVMIVRQEP